MTNIKNIDEYRDHYHITGLSGNCHVIPVSVINKIADGDMKITDLEEYDDIIPTIVGCFVFGLNQ